MCYTTEFSFLLGILRHVSCRDALMSRSDVCMNRGLVEGPEWGGWGAPEALEAWEAGLGGTATQEMM